LQVWEIRAVPAWEAYKMKTQSLVVALCLAGAVSHVAGANSDSVSAATTSYWLPKEQVQKYSEEAMDGSPEAANKLTNSYWMRGIPDRVKTRYWAVVGAENGDAESQFRAYQTLAVSASKLDQRRALFWLKKSAAQGFQFAESELKSCPTLSSTRDNGKLPCFGPESDQ